MAVKEFTIKNRLGIHARPAAKFAKTANEYQSAIRVLKDGLEVNGKSIMGIMMLAAAQGNVIQVEAEGPDEKQAIQALGELIENRFEEE
jgi:phosphocarrier protein